MSENPAKPDFPAQKEGDQAIREMKLDEGVIYYLTKICVLCGEGVGWLAHNWRREPGDKGEGNEWEVEWSWGQEF